MPLVLRKQESYYLFGGACFLSILYLPKLVMGLTDYPGFLDIVRGSIWKDVGKKYALEEFEIW